MGTDIQRRTNTNTDTYRDTYGHIRTYTDTHRPDCSPAKHENAGDKVKTHVGAEKDEDKQKSHLMA